MWRSDGTISSWLFDLTADALVENSDFPGWVSESQESRWTAIAAVEDGMSSPVPPPHICRHLTLGSRSLRQSGALIRSPRFER